MFLEGKKCTLREFNICNDILERIGDLEKSNKHFNINNTTFYFKYDFKDLKNACKLLGYKIKKSYTAGYYNLYF